MPRLWEEYPKRSLKEGMRDSQYRKLLVQTSGSHRYRCDGAVLEHSAIRVRTVPRGLSARPSPPGQWQVAAEVHATITRPNSAEKDCPRHRKRGASRREEGRELVLLLLRHPAPRCRSELGAESVGVRQSPRSCKRHRRGRRSRSRRASQRKPWRKAARRIRSLGLLC